MTSSTHRSLFLEAPLGVLLGRQAPPAVAAMLGVALGGLGETAWAGHLLGSESVAALYLASPFTLLQQAVTAWIAAGAGITLGRALGRRDGQTLQACLRGVCLVSAWLALPLAASYFLVPTVLGRMGGSGDLLEIASGYARVQVLGAGCGILSVALITLVRALGFAHRAALLTGTAVCVHLGLIPVFVQMLGLGLASLALASIVASAATAGLAFLCLRRSSQEGPATDLFSTSAWDLDSCRLVRVMLAAGLPALALQGGGWVRHTLLFAAAALYGTTWDLALFGAASRLYAFLVIPGFGILQALQPILATNLGAGRMDRARGAYRLFLGTGTALLGVLALPAFVLPEAAIHALLPGDPLPAGDVLRVRWILAALPVSLLSAGSLTYLQAAGQGRVATAAILLRQGILFPFAWHCLPPLFASPLDGLYALIAVENLVTGLALSALHRYLGSRSVRAIPPGSVPASRSASPSTAGVPGLK